MIEYLILGTFVAILVLGAASTLGASISEWADALANVARKKSNCSSTGAAASDGKCL